MTNVCRSITKTGAPGVINLQTCPRCSSSDSRIRVYSFSLPVLIPMKLLPSGILHLWVGTLCIHLSVPLVSGQQFSL